MEKPASVDIEAATKAYILFDQNFREKFEKMAEIEKKMNPVLDPVSRYVIL